MRNKYLLKRPVGESSKQLLACKVRVLADGITTKHSLYQVSAFFIHMGGKAIMEKAKILVTAIFTTLVLMTIGNLIPMIKQQNPDDLMIRYELVIHNTEKYSGLYADEVNADRGMQPFGLSVDVKRNDLHVYILAHKSSEDEVNEYVKWLVSYYGAEVVSGG